MLDSGARYHDLSAQPELILQRAVELDDEADQKGFQRRSGRAP